MKQIMPKLSSAIIYAMTPGFFTKLLKQRKTLANEPRFVDVFDDMASVDPGATQWDSVGLICAPSGEHYIENDSHISFVVQVNERKLPAKVRDELVQSKAAQIERQQGRRPHKKELRMLIEEAEMELLPKAFIGRSQTLISFTDEDKLIVWTTSTKRSERMTTLAMTWVGSFMSVAELGLNNITYNREQADVFTRIMLDEPGSSDTIVSGSGGVFKSSEGPIIRVRNRDLASDDMQTLINDSNYRAVELQMIYDSASNFNATEHAPDMTFTVNEGMIFKKIVVPGIEIERGEHAANAFDSQLFITMKTLLKVHAALGNELNVSAAIDDDDI